MAADARIPFLYVSSSSYSGSTLLAFLLNTHPDIFSVSEMDGWPYGEHEAFRCSCGEILRECPFFKTVASDFAAAGLPFDFRDFGTRYQLARHDRLNRALTAELPRLGSTPIERLRDRVVHAVPAFRRRLRTQDEANLTFVRAGLRYRAARVFVDGCKNPFRLRHLRRIDALRVKTVHLVRDVRGFALSNKTKRGWSVALSTGMWLREQQNIIRIAGETPPVLTLHYEDLCERTDEMLARVHEFVGVPPRPFGGDFKAVEHHILGNWMRLAADGRISRDTRWQREMSSEDLATVTRVTNAFLKRRGDAALMGVVRRYIADDEAEPSVPAPAESSRAR